MKYFPPSAWADMRLVLKGEGANGRTHATAQNWTHHRGKRVLNTDRGCFMISNVFHPDVSDAQAFDPDYAAQYAHGLWKVHGWKAWCASDNVGVVEHSC